MKIYRIESDGSFCVWDNMLDTIETIKNLIESIEFKDKITIDMIQMSNKEFESMPEFQGW